MFTGMLALRIPRFAHETVQQARVTSTKIAQKLHTQRLVQTDVKITLTYLQSWPFVEESDSESDVYLGSRYFDSGMHFAVLQTFKKAVKIF